MRGSTVNTTGTRTLILARYCSDVIALASNTASGVQNNNNKKISKCRKVKFRCVSGILRNNTITG